MKTVTQTKPFISSLEELHELTSENQLTAQDVIHRRMYINDLGWSDVEISHELLANIFQSIAEVLGGRQNTKFEILRNLIGSRPSHWGLRRIVLNSYNGRLFWSYIAGQDYSYELAEIRKALRK